MNAIRLPMERGEEPSFGFMNETLYSILQTKPFELACYQFVACHHRFDIIMPVSANQWTSTGFLRFESVDQKQIDCDNKIEF